MKSSVIALDRTMALLVGVLLVVVGVVAVLWWAGAVAALPDAVSLAWLTRATEQAWWPWMLALAGLLLVLVGLRYLFSHLPDRGVHRIVLPGSASSGRLHADVRSVAGAAAGALEDTVGVRSANGTIQRDRGQLVARLRATIEQEADLTAVAAAADRVSAELRSVLGRDDLRCRVQLSVAGRSRSLPRVR